MKIAIDLDGVVMRTMEAWLEQFHPEFKLEEFVHWNIFKHPKLNITEEQFYQELSDLDYSKVNEVEGAIDGILTLILLDHHVFFLSAKKEGSQEKTNEWLKYYGLGAIPVVFDENKLSHDFDYLLDDNPQYSSDPRVLILNREWNKNCSRVIDSWTGFVEVIKRLSNKRSREKSLKTFCEQDQRFDYDEVHKLLWTVRRIDKHTVLAEMSKDGIENGITKSLRTALFVYFGTQIEYRFLS